RPPGGPTGARRRAEPPGPSGQVLLAELLRAPIAAEAAVRPDELALRRDVVLEHHLPPVFRRLRHALGLSLYEQVPAVVLADHVDLVEVEPGGGYRRGVDGRRHGRRGVTGDVVVAGDGQIRLGRRVIGIEEDDVQDAG